MLCSVRNIVEYYYLKNTDNKIKLIGKRVESKKIYVPLTYAVIVYVSTKTNY